MAPEGVPETTKNITKTESQDRGRFSARRKTEAVLRLLRGGDPHPPPPSGGRAPSLDGATAAMKSRPADDRDELVARLQAKVGQLTMDNELLGQKCQHLESGRPFV